MLYFKQCTVLLLFMSGIATRDNSGSKSKSLTMAWEMIQVRFGSRIRQALHPHAMPREALEDHAEGLLKLASSAL